MKAWGRAGRIGGKVRRRPRRLIAAVLLATASIAVLLAPSSARAARATPAPIPGVRYGSYAAENLTVYPAASPGSRLVVLVHGGGWQDDSAATVASQAVSLQAAGFAVFAVNYRLDSSTVSAFPMERSDVVLAVRWAAAHAAQYDADSRATVLVGDSAGGELVAAAAFLLPPNAVRAVVTLSGAFDFGDLVEDGLAGTLEPLLAVEVGDALGCPLASCTHAVETRWSPDDHVTAAGCPGAWLLVNSQHELMPLDQPTAMTGALRSHRCSVTESILPGSLHAIQYWPTERPAVIRFIRTNG